MRAISFFREEIKKAFEWTAGLVWTLAKWLFRILLRLAFLSVFLFMVGGGCFLLKSHRESPRPTASPVLVQNAEPWPPFTEEPLDRARSENLQSQIRTGQSQVRSWDYTLRSIKRDIERFFRKR